ncbi:MAG: hypothetical protein K6F33_10550, partial [Bacteroidales bacterium]|nr:hypothetical protein [Bacteroidales bacterium]
MIAVIFAQGVAFGYDHYVYIENAQNIVSGDTSLSKLILSSETSFGSKGYSYIYLLLTTATFYVCEFFNMFDPRSKMFIIKLFHGLISLLTIYYSYRLAYRLGNRKAALTVGIIVSMLWFMPYISVKSLPENLASIFILAGVYRLSKIKKRYYKYGDDLFIGFLMGCAISFCYNTIIFVMGFAIAVGVISGKRRSTLLLLGSAISFFLLEGIIEMITLKNPFYVVNEYITAIADGTSRTRGSKTIYMYISLLAMMIPLPWGLMALWGYIKAWKRTFILFFPVTFYIIGSYLLPYKSEQFVLPIVPLFFIICFSGWYRYASSSRFWVGHPRLSYWLVVTFFMVNTPALILASISYTRQPQIETMLYLSRYKNDVESILVEDIGYSSSKSLPPFYMGKNIVIYNLNKQDQEPDPSIYYSSIKLGEYEHQLYTEQYFKHPQNSQETPKFVIFCGDYNMPERLANMRKIFPQITFEKKINPSFADKVIQFINP